MEPNFPTIEEQETLLGEFGLSTYFKKIEKILREYMDMKEEYYSLISLWIVGSYLHKQFSSYPYLFFNAMKGSGKTRMLKIIANLSKNGDVVGSMTEAVLFRTAYNSTICIDELENINSKGNENLGLLLNSAYKKGCDVKRMVKKKSIVGESQEVERFRVYCPLALANIRGMENVLADRCISVILEKSSNPKITKLIENFENDNEFLEIRGGLLRLTEKFSDDLNYFGDVFNKWNAFQKQDVLDIKDKFSELFSRIDKTNIQGRDLELFFPLFIIADMCGKEVLDDTLDISKEIVEEKRQQDREENMDIKIYEFVAQYKIGGYVAVSTLVEDFKDYTELKDEWINARYFGKGLRRLNLVLNEKRTSAKRQVKLDIEKAKEKSKMFGSKNPDFSDLDDVMTFVTL